MTRSRATKIDRLPRRHSAWHSGLLVRPLRWIVIRTFMDSARSSIQSTKSLALRKQPVPVHLQECVEVAKRGDHQASPLAAD